MRVDDLKPVDQEMLSRTLLPGEECRYMERASVCRWGWITCLEKLLEQGFVLTLFFFITAFSALVLLGWLRGSTSTASLLVAYIVLLLFYLLGWMMSTSGARRRLRKQVYLLTTHRAMILQPGECIRAYPLLPGMVRHLEQRPDGTGHLFFQLPEKEGGFEEACFAFVPEPRRVETLLNELAAQVPPLPDSPAAPVDWEMLPPQLRERMQQELRADEQVQWLGKTAAARQLQSPRQRRETLLVLLLALSALGAGGAACWLDAGTLPAACLLGVIYLVIAAFCVLILVPTEKDACVITQHRVCHVTSRKVFSYGGRLRHSVHYPGGAASLYLGAHDIDSVSVTSSQPLLILLRKLYEKNDM